MGMYFIVFKSKAPKTGAARGSIRLAGAVGAEPG
jgi:hypothetical protein